MKILNFKDFIRKYSLRKDTMNESGLQRLCKYPIYSRDSKKYSNKGFVNIDNSRMRGTHWTCFIIKDKKSYYFDSFGRQPDDFLRNQLLKPKKYHHFKKQDKNSNLLRLILLILFLFKWKHEILWYYIWNAFWLNKCR